MVLQFGGEAEVPSWVATVVQYPDVLAAVLGLFIASQALRGYRRKDSWPMLFISLGFALALGVPFALLLIATVLPSTDIPIIGILSQVAELLGLGAILYGLWLPA